MIFGKLGYYYTMSVTNVFCRLKDLYDLDDTPFFFLKVLFFKEKTTLMKETC
jgi:hypothetical protein